MNQHDPLRAQTESAFGEIQQLIYQLSAAGDYQTRNWLLNRLWNQVLFLHGLVEQLDQAALAPQNDRAVRAPQDDLPTLTAQQLSAYTGLGGMPAYVGVRGLIYDVTGNKAWSAATHFGLSAGRDLTGQFDSCHGAQSGILAGLKPVGRLL